MLGHSPPSWLSLVGPSSKSRVTRTSQEVVEVLERFWFRGIRAQVRRAQSLQWQGRPVQGMMRPVRITNALLANYVDARGSLASIMGGFPEWWNVPDLPHTTGLGLVVVAQVDVDELDKEFELKIRVASPDGPLSLIHI